MHQEIFNTFIGITKIYQQQNTGFMRFWIGPAQPVVVIYDAECAEVIFTILPQFVTNFTLFSGHSH